MGIRNYFKADKYAFMIVFIIALAVRVAYVSSLGRGDISPDGGDWISNAQNIASGLGYGDNWRAPVYSYFLAGIFVLKSGSLLLARLAQAFVDSLTCVLVYWIGKYVFEYRVGLLSSVITALYPYLIYYTGDILKETLFTFFVALSIFAFIAAIDRPNLVWKFLAGAVWGLTLLCKSIILPYYFLALAWYYFYIPERTGPVKLRNVLVILSAMLITISPWIARNSIRYKRLVFIEGKSAENLWQANNALSLKFETSMPHLDVKRLPDEYAVWYDSAEWAAIKQLPMFDAERVFKQRTLDFIRNNPRTFLELVSKRVVHYWSLFPRIATKRNKIVAMLTSAWILPAGWLGIFLSLRTHWRKTGILMLLIFSFTCVHTIVWAMIRYRVPIDPYMIIFCSYTLVLAYDRIKPSVPGNET